MKPSTLGELRDSGYQPQTVKAEMRKNLIQKMRKGDDIFPGIIGYEETVIPQIENAILSGASPSKACKATTVPAGEVLVVSL